MAIFKRLLQVALLVFTLVVGLSSAAIIVSQTVWFRDWLRGFVVRQGNQYLNGRLTIGRLGGNIFFGIQLEDLEISMNGEPVVTIKDAGIAYSVLQLLTRNMVITSLRLDRPVVHMRRDGGTWDLSQLIKKQAKESTRPGPGLPISIDDIVVTGGSFMFDDRPVGTSGVDVPRELNRLDARLSFAYAPVHFTVDISNVSFRGESPPFGLNRLSGRIAVTGGSVYLEKVAVRTASSSLKLDGVIYHYDSSPSLDVHATSDKFDIREVASIVPRLGRIDLQPAFDISAKGPLGNLSVKMDVRSEAGELAGELTADAASPRRRVAGTLHLRDFNLAPVVGDPTRRTDLTGVARIDMTMATAARGGTELRGTYDVRAEKAVALGYAATDVNAKGRIDGNRLVLTAAGRAYGGHATAVGTISLPSGRVPIGYNLAGRLQDTNLQRLPRSLKLPAVATRLNLDYRVSGTGTALKGDALLRPSTLAGARIGDNTRATFSYAGGQAAYSADGTVAGLNLARIGEQFKIAPLRSERFDSDVNGRFNVSGSGTSVATLRLDAAGELDNSSLFQTTVPRLAFKTAIADGRLQATGEGRFREMDPQRLTGSKAASGSLSGAFTVSLGLENLGDPSGEAASMLDSLSVDGRVALQPSTVAGLRIDNATVDARYAKRAGDIRQLTVTGPDVQLDARGAFTLTDHGQSNVQYKLATPSLASLAKLVDKPLAGAVTLAGQLTGNAAALRTTGTLKGANLGYAGSQALNMTSQYDVTLPNLDPGAARVGATTTATFVTLAGQQINKITAKTTYADRSLDFDANLEQPKRKLTATGDVLLHPEHQEVHLRSLGLTASGMEWQTAPGTNPAIRYGADGLTVEDLRLVNGSQEIAAKGTIGSRASDLQARLTNFDLKNVDALMLTDRQLGGTLNAQAAITGPRDALNVAGKFGVTGGSFRQFKYQSLNGTIDYGRNRLGLDVRLEENPQAWLAAKGSIPTAVFSATPGADANAPVDLRIESSPLDLGLVQGFTTVIQNATGTAHVDVRVTGTAAAPNMSGGVEIHDGGFKVVPTGVIYSALNSSIVLQPDRVTVKSLSIADNHKATLTVTGDLALHERQLGGVNLAVRGDDFKVVDNELGNVRLKTNVTVAGEVRQPRVTGTLAITTGTINVDKVLDLATSSAYSTSAESVPANVGGEPASQPIGQPVNQPAREAVKAPVLPGTPAERAAQPATPQAASSGNPYAAASIDVQFTVPDDLVVKGTDIRMAQSSVGMGNVNVTLGGDVRVQKEPGAALRLFGDVKTIRGMYEFQGRRFDMQRGGTLRFEGFNPPNPSLNITATRLITGVETRVHVGGSVRRPELTLSSSPPLDQADILSLIVFGQPSNQLGEGQQVSLAQRAGAIASGFVASRLSQSIGGALNLDTFEIQTAGDTGYGGATVTVGEQLGQRLYVKLRQGVGSNNTSEFVLDYQLTDFLRFETTMTQGGTPTRTIMQRVQQSGADLIFLFSF